jgi:hypothetical protein
LGYILIDGQYTLTEAVVDTGRPLNESLSTMWAQIKAAFSGGDKYEKKLQYFRKFYTLNDTARKRLVQIIQSRTKEAVVLDNYKLDSLFNSEHVEKHKQTVTNTYNNPGYGKNNSNTNYASSSSTYSHDVEYKTVTRGQESLHGKASGESGFNGMTNCTTYHKLYIDKSHFYLVYFTFDSDRIKDCQVLCGNSYGNTKHRFMKLNGIDDILSMMRK